MTGQRETVAFLTALAGAPPVETPISLVFLGHDTVWKLRKAVRLSFLDFTAVEDRRRFSERELALNSHAAPGLYRDVVPVIRWPNGTLALAGDGDIQDWVVRMARVPAGDFLDTLAASGGLPVRLLDQIADAVAAYHAGLPLLSDARPDMAAIAEGNVRSALAAGLPENEVTAWREVMAERLSGGADWREARAASGYVRRCHGDLHLANLCLWRGKPVPFDALEFDEALATIDVGYDLAFLLMDLEHRLDRAAANRVLNRYVARTGDADLVRGLPVFLSMRAMVRAHVEARSGRPVAARSYLSAAADYLVPRAAVVVAIGGLPGTGKSSLARALAPRVGAAPGALVVRSDEIRKRQHAVAPEQRLPAAAYSSRKSAAVFDELGREAETAARGGLGVIADATFLSLEHRALIEAAADRVGVPFVGIWLSAPHALLEQRIAGRTWDASDATVAVLRAAAGGDPGAVEWHDVDATNGEAALTLVENLLHAYIVH